MLYKIIPAEQHLEIRFNNDDTQCQFHHFYRSKHVTLFNMPKCASTTIKDYFDFLSGKLSQGHKTLVFLREPFARLRSAFRMKCYNEYGTNSFTNIICKYQNFLQGENIPYEHYNDMIHFIPQSSFIDAVGIQFDFEGILENLQESISTLNTKWDIDNYILKHKNKNDFNQEQNDQFNEEYEKNLQTNKTFYTDFLDRDIKLYDIRN